MSDWLRCVAHLDLDAFYAAVEEAVNPALKGQPVIIGMSDDIVSRGAVATANYAARKFGVHSAMPITQARKLCPQGVYLPVRHSLYREFSGRVMQILGSAAGVAAMEQVSIDEAYLEIDLSVAPDPVALMTELKRRITEQEKLTASVGLAANKLVAKMSSGYQKPDGLTVVPPGDEAYFLAPQPVAKLHGVGPKTAEQLNDMDIFTIGELAEADLEILQQRFGQKLGYDLKYHAAGIDTRPVIIESEVKSLSYEVTFSRDTADPRELWRRIQEMAEGLQQRMEQRRLLARTVGIKLRLSNWQLVTRALTLPAPTRDAREMANVAAGLMRANWRRGTALRLIGLRTSNFVDDTAPRQLLLPLKNEK
jgi:nucleotidyltransferase/DNA polymerase involved in DNA repair